MIERPWLRAALVYAFLVNAVVGVWATFSPRAFYDDFPGFGRVWVAVDGPFNEHLVRDTGSWALALAVLCAVAAWTLSRTIVVTAGVALAVQAVPHAVYHLRHTDPFDGTDLALSIGGIIAVAAVGVAIAAAGIATPRAALAR